jgi:4a-hydroxytetrahydrobiopterin dehydratase
MSDEMLSRTAASEAVESIGWRYLVGVLSTSVAVTSLARAGEVAQVATAACGAQADTHLMIDLRRDRVELALRTRSQRAVTADDVELARRVSAAISELGLVTAGATTSARPRPVQMIEFAIDTMDMAAIRPFWKAVLAYEDEPGYDGPEDAIVDPIRQGPAYWFQQMDAPRPQRNRIHIDITVAHDEADARVAAALAAGGRLVSDDEARAFWVLADVEGNEICVCTWQDRER